MSTNDEVLRMLKLRKELDPDAPDAIVFPESQIARFNRISKEERAITDAMVEAQRLADCVVDAAIKWHQSDMEGCLDEAQALEDAVEKLLEFRRKMPIVKHR